MSDFNVLIIGDCCTDNTEEVIRSFRDSRLSFVNLNSRNNRYPESVINHWLAGPVVPSNFALSRIKSRWIARIDDDDEWLPHHLENSVSTAEQNSLEFISAQVLEVRDGQKNANTANYLRSPYYGYRNEDTSSPKAGGTQTWVYENYLRFFKYSINCWRKKSNRVNDVDILMRMYRAGVRMGFIDQVHCKKEPRPGDAEIGLRAYLNNPDRILKEYRFTNS